MGLVASGQAKNEMPNDVALHFGGAGFDGVAASAQVGVGPEAVVDGVRVAAEKLAIGAEQFLCDLLEALVELTPEDFLDGAFGPGNPGGCDATESAHLVEAHDFDFCAALRQLLADEWIFAGGPAVTLNCAGKFDKAAD